MSQTADLLATALDQIQKSEYEIRWQESARTFQSPNRAQALRFTYFDSGFKIEPRVPGDKDTPWEVSMSLLTVEGTLDWRVPSKPPQWSVAANLATVECEAAEGNQAYARCGYSVAGGTVDTDDSYGDIIVGLPYYDTTSLSKTDNGEAWFYRGRASNTPVFDAQVIGGASGDLNGWSVARGEFVTYRHPGIIVGAPSAGGGTATVWDWTP